MINCSGCDHLYYDNGGAGYCDAPYENSCLKLLHKWHTHPELFIEDTLNVKLKWYQKIYLKIFLKGNTNDKNNSIL